VAVEYPLLALINALELLLLGPTIVSPFNLVLPSTCSVLVGPVVPIPTLELPPSIYS